MHRRERRVGVGPSAALLLVLVLLYVPLGYVVVSSFNRNPLSGGWRGFTLDWYDTALRDPAARDAFWTSLRLAVLSAVGATAAGTALALGVRRRPRLQLLGRLASGGRIASPEIIMATGLGVLLPRVGIRFGFVPMAIAHIAYLSAYAAVLVGARAANVDPVLEETALDLGASPWRTMWKVVLPDLRPGIVAALLLTAAFSFDDVALSLALRGPQDTTLPTYLLSAVQRRVTPSIHAIGVLIMTVGLGSCGLAALANRAILRQSASNHVA